MALTIDQAAVVRRGELPSATHVGACGEPGDGPYVRLWLRIEEGRILDASCAVPGCPSSVAAASMTVRLILGRKAEEALRLEPQDLLLILGGLPDGRGHLAGMCVEALRSTLGER